MPFISREFLRLSLETLKTKQPYSPLLTVSVPCMLRNGLPTSSSGQDASKAAKTFGGKEERDWLDEYFRPGGGPAGKPYYMPGTEGWVDQRYPDTSLQRRRTDNDGHAFYHPTMYAWAFREGLADSLKSRLLKGKPAIPLVAMMGWMWRTRALPAETVAENLKRFINEVGFDRDGLLGKVYSADVPAAFVDAGLALEALTATEIADLIGAAPPPPTLPPFTDTVTRLEETLTAQHLVRIPGLAQRILGGWLVGDIVVLVGPSGSGKTTMARALAEGLEELVGVERIRRTFIEIGKELDVAEFIGYENLAGDFVAGRFTSEVLFAGEPTDMRVVILDEWNLSQIDRYLAPLLSVLESQRPILLPGRINAAKFSGGENGEEDSERDFERLKRCQPSIENGECSLPEDTFMIATCNSWIDEPESRHQISGPVKRRCRIISMPNILELRFSTGGEASLIEVCDSFIAQERDLLAERTSTGRLSILDTHRRERLDAIANFAAIDEKTRRKLLQLCTVLLKNAQTKNTFTVGILRDIVLSCVYALPDQQFAALGEQVADKVIHQVLGDPAVLKALLGVSSEFPNIGEIQALADRMGASGTQSRIRPLV